MAHIVGHLRSYGTLTEAEITRIAGGARGYRKLRRALEKSDIPLMVESTGRGSLWRLGEEA
jgi:hypothetical protein